jgi:cytochrome c oxidase subunit 1
MFQSGMDPRLGTGFMVATVMIALPSAVKVFNWIGTIYQGNIQWTTPMLWALAFVAMFIIGGLSGIFMAATPVDIYIHDTYFIVAHIHYVLFTSSLFGIFGAIYFWFPKMFGRYMNDFWGPDENDIFAVGVVWYQVLVGRLERPPYDFANHLRDHLVDSQTIRVIERCLAQPDRRFKDASELEQALDSLPQVPDWTPPPNCFDVQHLAREYLTSQA